MVNRADRLVKRIAELAEENPEMTTDEPFILEALIALVDVIDELREQVETKSLEVRVKSMPYYLGFDMTKRLEIEDLTDAAIQKLSREVRRLSREKQGNMGSLRRAFRWLGL